MSDGFDFTARGSNLNDLPLGFRHPLFWLRSHWHFCNWSGGTRIARASRCRSYVLVTALLSLFLLLAHSSVQAQTCDLINEQFDSGTPPAGWVQNGNYFGTTFPFSGTTFAGFNTLNDQLTLAAVDCPGQICFYWRASGSSSNWDVDVEWSDDSGANWNIDDFQEGNRLLPKLFRGRVLVITGHAQETSA